MNQSNEITCPAASRMVSTTYLSPSLKRKTLAVISIKNESNVPLFHSSNVYKKNKIMK